MFVPFGPSGNNRIKYVFLRVEKTFSTPISRVAPISWTRTTKPLVKVLRALKTLAKLAYQKGKIKKFEKDQPLMLHGMNQ